MFRLNLLSVYVAAAFAAESVSTTRGADKTDAKSVVKKGIEFLGGEKNLKKYKAVVSEDKGTYYGMGDGLPYTGKYSVVWPDKFRMEIKGIFTSVLNGKSGWAETQGSVRDMTKKEVEAALQAQHERVVMELLPLLDAKIYTLTLDGTATVGKVKAVVVKVQSKGQRDVRLFFNPESGELVKSEMMATPEDFSDKLVKQESFVGGYKTADGIKYATNVRITRDGKKYIDSTVTAYKPLETLPEKTFAKPKSPR